MEVTWQATVSPRFRLKEGVQAFRKVLSTLFGILSLKTSTALTAVLHSLAGTDPGRGKPRIHTTARVAAAAVKVLINNDQVSAHFQQPWQPTADKVLPAHRKDSLSTQERCTRTKQHKTQDSEK